MRKNAIPFYLSIAEHLVQGEDKVAYSYGDISLTYEEMLKRVVSWQQVISKSTDDRLVGIYTSQESDPYCAIIALWLMGRGYVPLNHTFPEARLREVIKNSGVEYVIGEDFPNSLQDFEQLQYEDVEAGLILNSSQLSDVAYLMFTSGSTGKPKGVPITFGNLDAFVQMVVSQDGWELNSSDHFLQMFHLTFDLSVFSFAIPLTLGASFHVVDQEGMTHFETLEVLESREVTVALMVPSIVDRLSKYIDEISLPELRLSLFCGEALHVQHVEDWRKAANVSAICNVYGPTEATIFCSRYDCPQEGVKSTADVVTIGKGIGDTTLSIQNGELQISGNQVASYYWKWSGANSPFENGTYSTGDLAEVDEEGDFFFLGRKDSQVQIGGFRVELSEIESLVRNRCKIQNAKAIYRKDENKPLTLFIHLDILPEGVDEILSNNLPTYMIPHQIVPVKNWPLTPNGKTDVKGLLGLMTSE